MGLAEIVDDPYRSLLDEGKPLEVIAQLQHIGRQMNLGSIRLQLYRLEAFIAANDSDGAIDDINDMISFGVAPPPSMYAKLGHLLLSQKRWENAYNSFFNACKLPGEDDPGWYVHMGFALSMVRDFSLSALWYARALDESPDDQELICRLARSTLYSGDWNMSRRYYERAIDVDETRIFPHVKFGQALLLTGERDAARERFERALELYYSGAEYDLIDTKAAQEAARELDIMQNYP